MEVEGGGQRCCREKEWSTGYPPPNPFKKIPQFKRFLCISTRWPVNLTGLAHCGLMTGTSLYGKSKGEPQFCARTTERSLASSTCGRRRLTSELQHFPRAILHHVLWTGGASNITIALCPLLFFFFSAWNSRCASVCPIVTSSQSHRAVFQAHLPTEGHSPDPLFTRSEYS